MTKALYGGKCYLKGCFLLTTITPGRSYLSYFRPTKFKTHYVAPQFLIFRRTVQIAPNFLHSNAHIFLFWLNPTGHSKFYNTSKRPPIPVGLLVLPCTRQCRRPTPYSLPPFFPIPDRATGEGRYCARNRGALQHLALNTNIKHSDLT